MDKRYDEVLAKEIGGQLRKIRRSKSDDVTKLTQNDVARSAAISLRQYANIENGKRLPSFQVIGRLASVYGESLSSFTKNFENIDFFGK